MTVGIIAEYNPFHNGHAYHLTKVRELYPEATIVLVTNGVFCERGEAMIYDKWKKTELALQLGIDLVVELPFPFATQSADFFARGAIEIFDNLGVDAIVFGSECNDIAILKKAALLEKKEDVQKKIKNNILFGMNYPTALAKVLEENNIYIQEPNDILGVCYIKEIEAISSKIIPVCIQRTNSYHEKNYTDTITNATSIRTLLQEKKNVQKFVPKIVFSAMKETHFIEEYFHLLKYKIKSEWNTLNRFQTVDEGIENRIKKYIISSNSLEELIQNVKTKRYTYNKIKRMFIHILCGFTKEEAKRMQHISYIRVLGFNSKGQKHLKTCKKISKVPIITNFSTLKNEEMLQLEMRVTRIYASILSTDKQKELIEAEYKNLIIKKEKVL